MLTTPALQVTNCTGGILSLAAQQLSLAGQATGNTTYQMYASNSSAQSTNTCNVTLLNSQARRTSLHGAELWLWCWERPVTC